MIKCTFLKVDITFLNNDADELLIWNIIVHLHAEYEYVDDDLEEFVCIVIEHIRNSDKKKYTCARIAYYVVDTHT